MRRTLGYSLAPHAGDRRVFWLGRSYCTARAWSSFLPLLQEVSSIYKTRNQLTFILPHLSMPQRGPTCQRGYYWVLHLIVRGLYTGRPWQGLPVPTAPDGQPALPSTTIDTVLAPWAAAGSLWPAWVARVRHRG